MRFLRLGGGVFILLLGIWGRFVLADNYFQSLVQANMENVFYLGKINGFVLEISSQSPALARFYVASEAWPGRLFVTARALPWVRIGQRVEISGKFESFHDIDPGGFKNFLLLKNVWATVEASNVDLYDSYKHNWQYYAASSKMWFNSFLLNNFSTKVSGLLAGVLLGDTSLLSAKVKEDFRISGLSHLMAISGANMTMIAEAMFRCLAFLTLKRRVFVTVVILTIFTLLVGASAAVIRAYIMSLISLLALHMARPYLAKRALLAVVLIVFFWNPYIPLYDIGFQLSVAATTGLLFLVPIFNRLSGRISGSLLMQTTNITIAATLATIPLSLYYFNTYSFLAPLINILFVPILAGLSVYGYILFVLSFVPFVGSITSLLGEYVLAGVLGGVAFAARLADVFRFNYTPSLTVVLALYVIGCVVVGLFSRHNVTPRKTSRVARDNPVA